LFLLLLAGLFSSLLLFQLLIVCELGKYADILLYYKYTIIYSATRGNYRRSYAISPSKPDSIWAQILQRDNSTTEDHHKQKHAAARWTSVTVGREGRYDIESEVGDHRLQRVDI